MFLKTSEPASVVLEQALTLAQATDRNVLIHFYADWCNWCHYLDASLSACAVQPLLQKHFVIVTLVEDGGEGEENPGTWEMRRDLGGASCGVPYMAVLDKDGEKLADSKYRGEYRGNIGCPNTKAEIVAFGKMLKTAAPDLCETELEQVLDYFRNAPWRRASLRW